MDVQWATFWALVCTLCAIVWQAKATADSAAAAKQSADVAAQGLIIANRAYVDIGDWKFVTVNNTGVGFLYKLKVKERTRATVLGGEIRMSIDEPIMVKRSQPIVAQIVSAVMQHHQMAFFPDEIPAENWKAWEAGTNKMFIAGFVRYLDAFPSTPVHRKYFCFACIGPNGTFTIHQPGGLINANYEEDEKES